MKRAPSPEAKAYSAWIDSLTPDDLRKVEGLGVSRFDEPSFFGRTVEDFQTDRIEAPEADDADWNLRLDLLDAGAPAERLDDICEVIELHGETVAFRHARHALHQISPYFLPSLNWCFQVLHRLPVRSSFTATLGTVAADQG